MKTEHHYLTDTCMIHMYIKSLPKNNSKKNLNLNACIIVLSINPIQESHTL